MWPIKNGKRVCADEAARRPPEGPGPDRWGPCADRHDPGEIMISVLSNGEEQGRLPIDEYVTSYHGSWTVIRPFLTVWRRPPTAFTTLEKVDLCLASPVGEA